MGFSIIRDLLQRHIGEQKLSAYVDERLSVHERQRVERHLKTCTACRGDLAELRTVLTMLKRAPMRSVPRSFTLPLSVQSQQTAFRRWDKAYGALRVAAVAASFLLILFLSGDALVTRGVIPMPDRMPVASAPLARTMQEYADVEALSEPVEEETVAIAEREGEEAPRDAAPLALSIPSEDPAPVEVEVEAATADEVPTVAMGSRERDVVGAPHAAKDRAPEAEAEAEVLALEAVEPQPEEAAGQGEKAAPERIIEPIVPESAPMPPRVAEQQIPLPQEPTIVDVSIAWRLWYVARVLSGILLGIVLVLGAGLIWIGHKRRI